MCIRDRYCKERHFSCSSLLKITRWALTYALIRIQWTHRAWHTQTPVYLNERMECVHRSCWWCLWVDVEKMCRTWYLAPEIRFGMLRWFAKRRWCCGICAHTHPRAQILCAWQWYGFVELNFMKSFNNSTLECAYSFKSECRWHFLHFHPWKSQTHTDTPTPMTISLNWNWNALG